MFLSHRLFSRCEKVCLSKKIKMINKKPVWKKDVQCFYCYACINYCPKQSVQIKSFTEKNGRYSHPYATSDDIARQKCFWTDSCPLPSSALLPSRRLHSTRVPLLICSACPCGEGAGRCFPIIPAGFGCEEGMDALVSVNSSKNPLHQSTPQPAWSSLKP